MSKDNTDGHTCDLQSYKPEGDPVALVHTSFQYLIFAGVSSALLLAWYVVMTVNRKIFNKTIEQEQEFEQGRIREDQSHIGRFFRRLFLERKLVPAIIVSMGFFIANWVLWGSKSSRNYCEVLRC